MPNILTELEARGFIDALTSKDLVDATSKPLKIYIGFDPTADSLHLGNLMGIVALTWFHRFGHQPVAVIGGATGMIGDPSGKSQERNLLDAAVLERNVQAVKETLEKIFKRLPSQKPIQILNNYDWLKGFSYLEFLRDVGKHFRLGVMLSKDSVKSRLASEEGISYTEFSYQLLQAYDFLHLFDQHDVLIQAGGSDQWGNIVAGTELIRKVRGKTAYGLTFPLLTRSDGKKFGKSEEGAIWLSSQKLPPYDFYQYLYRIADADVIKLLKLLTFCPLEEIKALEEQMKLPSYVPQTAQKKLAEEVTRFVHGEEGLQEALNVTKAAAPGLETSLDGDTLEKLASQLSKHLPLNEVVGVPVLDLFVKANLVTSKGEARRLIDSGGAYLNNQRVEKEDVVIQKNQLIEGKYLLLAAGKKRKIVIKVFD